MELIRSGGKNLLLYYPYINESLDSNFRQGASFMSVNFPDSSILEASVIKALKSHGGIARTEVIDKFVCDDLKLTPEQRSEIRSGNRTEIQYRLAWVRTKAKGRGLIEKSANRTWKLKS